MSEILSDNGSLPDKIKGASQLLISTDPDKYVPSADAFMLGQEVEDYLETLSVGKPGVETAYLTLEQNEQLIILKSSRIINLMKEKYPLPLDSEIRLAKREKVKFADQETIIDFSYYNHVISHDFNEEEFIFYTYNPDSKGSTAYYYVNGCDPDWSLISPSGKFNALEDLDPKSMSELIDFTVFVLDALYLKYSEE